MNSEFGNVLVMLKYMKVKAYLSRGGNCTHRDPGFLTLLGERAKIKNGYCSLWNTAVRIVK